MNVKEVKETLNLENNEAAWPLLIRGVYLVEFNNLQTHV